MAIAVTLHRRQRSPQVGSHARHCLRQSQAQQQQRAADDAHDPMLQRAIHAGWSPLQPQPIMSAIAAAAAAGAAAAAAAYEADVSERTRQFHLARAALSQPHDAVRRVDPLWSREAAVSDPAELYTRPWAPLAAPRARPIALASLRFVPFMRRPRGDGDAGREEVPGIAPEEWYAAAPAAAAAAAAAKSAAVSL